MDMELSCWDFRNMSDEEFAELEEGIKQFTPEDWAALRASQESKRKMVEAPGIFPEITVSETELEANDGKIWIVELLKRAGYAKTTSEARNLLKSGAIRLGGVKIKEPVDVFVNHNKLLYCGKQTETIIRITA